MSENPKMKPKSRQLQFMLSGVGFGAAGKKRKMKANPKKHKAIPLTSVPNLPRLNREGRRGSPLIRFVKMQAMTIIYEDTRPSWPRDVITLKAMVDPMMIRERSVVQSRVTMIALAGTSQSDRTCGSS